MIKKGAASSRQQGASVSNTGDMIDAAPVTVHLLHVAIAARPRRAKRTRI